MQISSNELEVRISKSRIRAAISLARTEPLKMIRTTIANLPMGSQLLGAVEFPRLTMVPFWSLTCQNLPFSEVQGFSGKPINYFPPCGFYELALEDTGHAHQKFSDWLRYCLVELEAWKIPRSQGGWEDGTLMRAIHECHKEHGIWISDISDAVPKLIDEAIASRTRYYLDLFASIRNAGYRRLSYPPIYCLANAGSHVIYDGHHRCAALWVLGYNEVNVRIIGQVRNDLQS